MVVPKKHIQNVMKLTEEDTVYLQEVYKAVQEIAKEKQINETGFRVLTNNGEDAGQTIKHLHFHILGGRKMDIMG